MQGASFTRPVWAEISRRRLIANYRALRALVPPRVGVLAMVKANAYGHGVDLCAPIVASAGRQGLRHDVLGPTLVGVSPCHPGQAIVVA